MKSKYYMLAVLVVAVVFYCAVAVGDSPHHDHPPSQIVNEYYTTEVYETYQITETIYATEEQVSSEVAAALEAINPETYTAYTPDECQGIAVAAAGANNQMHMGTKKPQLSLGLGECNGEFASSLMFGMRINPNIMLNGNWMTDERVDAYGIGINVVLP